MNTICLSENTNKILKDALRSRGYDIIEIRATDAVYDAIASHGDIYLCRICDELVAAPEQLVYIRDALMKNHVKFTPGSSELGCKYPENIKYNAAQIGRYLIHNTKFTDTVLLEKADAAALGLIPVKQGYTKCSLVVVDDHSAVTADMGLASELRKYGIDVLTITPGYVRLTGFPSGFLGGASGRVGTEIFFNGDLSAHPDHERIVDFIQKRGLQAVWFEEYPLEDIGSIIQV